MSKSVFDHANHILKYQNKEYYNTLDDSDKGTFSTFMLNRILSYVNKFDYIFIPELSEIDSIIFKSKLPLDIAYMLYINTIPKNGMYNIQYKKSNTPDQKYTPELINILSNYLEISKETTILYLHRYYSDDAGMAYLRKVLESYGFDTKEIKKMLTTK